MIAFVHFSVGPSAVPLIADMSRVCYAKMQVVGKKPAVTVQTLWVLSWPMARPIQKPD
jgi:hypothetical protein